MIIERGGIKSQITECEILRYQETNGYGRYGYGYA